jgi:hypothetical protein
MEPIQQLAAAVVAQKQRIETLEARVAELEKTPLEDLLDAMRAVLLDALRVLSTLEVPVTGVPTANPDGAGADARSWYEHLKDEKAPR